jgi:hypothetical protein
MQANVQVREDWIPISIFPPIPCESYEVKLTDGRVIRAFWSGKAWWYQGKAVAPIRWRDPEFAAA